MAMSSSEAVAAIMQHREDGAIAVCTMTSMKWLHEFSPSPLNVSSVPMMGGASALGLGLALAQPTRKVLVLDGDGSLLMQLGSLATVVEAAPANFVHFVFDNGVWFEGGANLGIPGGGRVDFAGVARAAGYAATYAISELDELQAQLPAILDGPSPAFVHLRIEPLANNLWSADNPPAGFPESQFVRMGEEARRLKAALLEAAG